MACWCGTAAPRGARSVSLATPAAAADSEVPVPAQCAQALGAARCVSGESAPVDDGSQTLSAGSSSEGESARVKCFLGAQSCADACGAPGANATRSLGSHGFVPEVRSLVPAVLPPACRHGILALLLTCALCLQASEAVTHERLIERQILRERLALEGAASTYRKIGAHKRTVALLLFSCAETA